MCTLRLAARAASRKACVARLRVLSARLRRTFPPEMSLAGAIRNHGTEVLVRTPRAHVVPVSLRACWTVTSFMPVMAHKSTPTN